MVHMFRDVSACCSVGNTAHDQKDDDGSGFMYIVISWDMKLGNSVAETQQLGE